jgi:hypothetical protein
MVTMLGAVAMLAVATAGVALWRVERAEARRETQPSAQAMANLPRVAPQAIVEAPLPVGVEAVAVPAPRRAEPIPSPAREGELRVRRLIVATGVEGREPVGAAETFARGEADRLYGFVELGNRTGEEHEVVLTFEPEEGDAVGHIELTVGTGARWRTWGYTRMLRPGSWDAVVRDGEGRELARTSFVITG